MADGKSRFGALKTFRQQVPEVEIVGRESARESAPNPVLEPIAGRGRGRPAGKRSNPDYEPTTVLLRKKTKKAAIRLLEDGESGQDLSDLIESLLANWTAKSSIT